jgi:hypothetical protein
MWFVFLGTMNYRLQQAQVKHMQEMQKAMLEEAKRNNDKKPPKS